MKAVIWLVVVIVVVLVVIGALLAARNRRRAALQEQFGPEYDRVVEGSEDRRSAEADLRQRQREHDQLELRPLTSAARMQYVEEWRVIQEHFVDQPVEAVGSANTLLTQVMHERGYPVADFESRAELISVEHPDVVENYRVAHRLHESNQQRTATTEDLREALLRYRSLFSELLRDPEAEGDAGRRETANGGTL